MPTTVKEIIKDALSLPPIDRATIIDSLVSSLNETDETIDNLWKNEVEDRIKAYQEGKIKTVSLQEVLAKYQK